MCERVIDEGMLAGSTEAEVDTWSAKMVVLPQPMDEDELADFMLECWRIHAQRSRSSLRPPSIQYRLAIELLLTSTALSPLRDGGDQEGPTRQPSNDTRRRPSSTVASKINIDNCYYQGT